MEEVKILIVENEMLLAAEMAMDLETLGYNVVETLGSGEEAIDYLKSNEHPDIMLMDIQLDGAMDGIQTVKVIKSTMDIPVIYLTANTDDLHFRLAKDTRPEAFISKPFKKLDLQRAIELTVERVNARKGEKKSEEESVDPLLLHDFIYVKHGDRMVKVNINDIQYIEAERNYSRIFAKEKEYLLVMTLKDLEAKLPSPHFLRIHRSYVINITRIDELTVNHIIMDGTTIPISKSQREELMKRLPMI